MGLSEVFTLLKPFVYILYTQFFIRKHLFSNLIYTLYKSVYIVYIMYIQKEKGTSMKLILKTTVNNPFMNKLSNKKENILKGYVAPGEHLPSMRELAKDLQVSLITTKRAYEDLERMDL